MTEGRRSDRDQQGPGRQIPSPEASMAAGLGGAERNGAGSVQPLETVRDQSLRPWHERPLPSSSPALTFPPVPPAPGTRDLRPAVRHPSVPSPTPALPRAPAWPQTTLCQDGDGNGASVTPVTPTPGAPGDAREGTGRHVLPQKGRPRPIRAATSSKASPTHGRAACPRCAQAAENPQTVDAGTCGVLPRSRL